MPPYDENCFLARHMFCVAMGISRLDLRPQTSFCRLGVPVAMIIGKQTECFTVGVLKI